jgi:hypothetical protein
MLIDRIEEQLQGGRRHPLLQRPPATTAATDASKSASSGSCPPRRDFPLRPAAALGITASSAEQASPERLADLVGAHWRIEALHHIRDVTYDEDRS